MGLFHLANELKLRALLDGISIFQRARPTPKVRLRCRCEYIRPHVFKDTDPVEVLPFSTEAQIDRDLENADLLYLPMPFGTEHESFVRYSISTKMVTYVGSGVPILYHGPTGSAAFELLSQNQAAIMVTTLEPREIAVALESFVRHGGKDVAANATELAQRQFMLADQRKRFWNVIGRAVDTK